MTEVLDDGGPAFPNNEQRDANGSCVVEPSGGMSLQDYFAAHCPITLTEFLIGWTKTKESTGSEAMSRFAELRIEYADAMIAAGRRP
jgi:hypothetical protein